MTDIEKRAFEAYPEDVNMVVVPSSGLTPIDSNEKYRDGYIKCAEEYESLPKIHGWVARDWGGTLNVFSSRPFKKEHDCKWDCMDSKFPIKRCLFSELTWESEPVEVELLIRKV